MNEELTHIVTPHPERQRSYAELRSEFRAQRLEDLRSQMSKHQLGWGVVGDPEKSRVHYTAEQWCREMLLRLDDPVTQDFGLGDLSIDDVNLLGALLESLAQESEEFERVTWPPGTEGTVDHDAPALEQPVAAMSDEALCDYVEMSIIESEATS